ncbi:MAG: Glycosyl transferase, group 2 family [Cytophagales bacterium]|nr:glycosyltransferase family 2 protein [Bacteroidota bacterium]MBS1980536.1 glycosyltransferase family 2 protein [Bacteroidota bacterium]WHZ07855.1 MAG: Glycosyl transferase, group 2 family [Cytophagales bacterium]
MDISFIIPAKDEEESIVELSQWISRVMLAHNFSYEIIFVDDGSSDGTWQQIKKANGANSLVKGLKFNRNFGKAAALNVGFKSAQGDVVITMDADLQDSPDEVPELYRMIREQKFDLVSGWKKKRHDPISKRWPSKFFNGVVSRMSGIKLHDFNCGLKAYNASVVKNISIYGDMHRYIPVIAKWAGFTKITEKVVEHRERKFGHSKYGWTRLVSGFLDLLTLMVIGKFSRKPMHLFGTMGIISFLAGFIFTIKILWDKVDAAWITKVPLKRDVTEQPIFYLALVAVVIGVQLFLAGFLAELLARQTASKKDYLVIEKV